MTQRGVIRNRQFRQRIADMSGLTFGKITPTDLDAFMEFGNRLFVFVESKFGEPRLSYGQKLALERLCDACHAPPERHAVVLVTSYADEGDIDLANTKVEMMRWAGEWRAPKREGSTLVDAVNAFRDKYIVNAPKGL